MFYIYLEFDICPQFARESNICRENSTESLVLSQAIFARNVTPNTEKLETMLQFQMSIYFKRNAFICQTMKS